MLMQALRVAAGQPVFVAPNADFAPHVYMLLTTWLGGRLLRITGPSFLPLRLLSFAATLATAGSDLAIARRESRSWLLAGICGCLYLAGYRIAGGWYELVKVDPLFVALTLAGVAATIYGWQSAGGLALAGLLLALSFLTKQNGLFYAALAGIYLLTVARRRTWIFAAVFAGVALVPISWYRQLQTAGSAPTHSVSSAANPMAWQRVVATVIGDLLGAMVVLSAMALITLGEPSGDLLSASRRISRALCEEPVDRSALAVVCGRGNLLDRGWQGFGGRQPQPFDPGLCVSMLAPALFMEAYHPGLDRAGGRGSDRGLAGAGGAICLYPGEPAAAADWQDAPRVLPAYPCDARRATVHRFVTAP